MRTGMRRMVVLGIAATALTLAAAAPAIADPSPEPSPEPSASASAGTGVAPGAGTGTSTGAEPRAERAAKVCARLPRLEARLDRVLARIRGDATTPGSVAFLRKRAERARANGDTDLAAALDSRAKAREDLVPVLSRKKAGLPKVTEWCAGHGHPVTK